MAEMIIEILNRAGRTVAYHRVRAFPVSIGRGYGNDLIINDPFISAEHLLVSSDDEGRWLAEDLGSDNGCLDAHGNRIKGAIVLQSGDTLRLGESILRFVSSTEPVAPPRQWHPVSRWIERWGRPPMTWPLVLLTFALIVYANSFDIAPGEKFTSQLVIMFVTLLMICIAWASIWAFVGRLIHHLAHFHRQMLVSALFLVAIETATSLTTYVEYFTSSWQLGMGMNYVFSGLLIGLGLYYNMEIGTGLGKKKRILFSQGIAWSLIGLVALMVYFGEPGFSSAKFSTVLKPPAARLASAQSVGEFFDDCDKLY